MDREKKTRDTTHVCMYGHTYSKSVDQPGKVANPAARGQLNTGKMNISLSAFAPENMYITMNKITLTKVGGAGGGGSPPPPPPRKH